MTGRTRSASAACWSRAADSQLKSDVVVVAPPAKPLMIFDGDCNFCTLWIRRWQQATGEAVEYLPFQDPSVAAQFPELPRERCETAVHLVEPDGAVYSGAEAVFRALAHNPSRQRLLGWYQRSPAFARFTEGSYRFVAEHRPLFSRLTRWGWGRRVERPTHRLVGWLFLRALGMIYLIAFLSLWSQMNGLIGHDGIWPTEQSMTSARQYFDSQGTDWGRFHQVPTLCWLSASDRSLAVQCGAGVVLSGLLLVGVAPAVCLFLLWLLYLSLSSIGGVFLSYQWDALLLETGFLAIFLAALQLVPRPRRAGEPSRLMVWLLRWLLFRLMFESGCVKLLSGDPLWRKLTALTVHYQTQPLPTWVGWYAHQLPAWAQKGSCLVMFAIELAAPFLVFAPRRLRFVGGAALVLLQVLIALTGNYTFFNWLTLALCLLLLDDFTLEKVLPARLRRLSSPTVEAGTKPIAKWPRVVTVPLAAVVLCISLFQLVTMFGVRSGWLGPVAAVQEWLGPFRSLNRYGLFAVMTPSRPELIIEGSTDGVTWKPYEFKYKPGDLRRRPAFVAPHQPRLDWQMWFEALHTLEGERPSGWFINFCVRLLQGSPTVLSLLERNPFPEHPPRFLRVVIYDYRFTTFAERRATGAWWQRKEVGQYVPVLSLREEPKP